MIERWDGRAAERLVRVVCDGESFPLEAAVATAPQWVRGVGAAAELVEAAAPLRASA
jgi:hypothetical protein